MQLGDPFRINIPLENINSNDTNYVGLRLGNNNSEYILPTSSSKVIYSILLPPTFSYSSPVGKREGCIWTIQSEDQGGNPGNNFTLNIPSTYNGSNICSYTAATGANIEDNQDAYELAVLNLLQDSLDLDNDNMTEVNIGADLSINVVLVQGIPFMHYTMARAMSWR